MTRRLWYYLKRWWVIRTARGEIYVMRSNSMEAVTEHARVFDPLVIRDDTGVWLRRRWLCAQCHEMWPCPDSRSNSS